jgi:hypothetical protein
MWWRKAGEGWSRWEDRGEEGREECGVEYLSIEVNDLEILKSKARDSYRAADSLSEEQSDVGVVHEVEVADAHQALLRWGRAK